MGESISEATIGTILKDSGSRVAADDELIELETDKVNQVLYAPQAGVVHWSIKKDDQVKIGQVLGTIETSQEAVAPPAPSPKTEKPVPVEQPPAAAKKPEAQAPPSSQPSPLPSTKPLPAPSAEARITKDSFIAELAPKKAPTQPAELPAALASFSSAAAPGERRESRKKMSRIRKVIAARLVEAQHQTAMLTTFNEADMSHIMALRDSYKDPFTKLHNTRLGFMSFFIKASVSALKAFPNVNAYIDGEDIVTREYYDIGVAVGTEKGLFVPIIKHCDTLSFADIERAIENFAKKARDGNLVADDLQGGGFTITNGGIYGSLLSTPILNPPQSAILGMHKIMKRPVVVNDEIVIRQMMYLALSYDHRIIDGKEAVSFLVHIKNNLEDPSRMLLDV